MKKGGTYGLSPLGFKGFIACSTLCGGASAAVDDDEVAGASGVVLYL